MNLCEQYEPYLAAIVDGETGAIPLEVRSQIEAHVRSCPTCQSAVAAQRQIVRLVADSAPPAVSTARWQEVWNAVDDQTTRRNGRLWPSVFAGRTRWLAAGSCVAVAAMVLVAVLLRTIGRPIDTATPFQPAQTYAFATPLDSDIESVEAYDEDETPIVITSGRQDVVVVWMIQNPQKSNT